MTKARDYAKEYRDYQGTPQQIKNRAERNKARSAVEKKLGHKLSSDQDVDHKTPMKNGGGGGSNLRVISEHKNSAWRRGQKGYKVGKA